MLTILRKFKISSRKSRSCKLRSVKSKGLEEGISFKM